MTERIRPSGATIREVAAEAAVSRATVSRVINGAHNVSPDIRKRVLESISKLEFVPSEAARSLSLGRTLTVGFLVPSLNNPLFQSILQGVTVAAELDGFHVLVSDSREDIEAEITLAAETRRRCDAIILCSPRLDGERLIELLPQLAPVAVINHAVVAPGVPQVATAYRQTTGRAVDHLVELGHKHLFYFGRAVRTSSSDLRETGLDEALVRYDGLRIDRLSVDPSLKGGWDHAHNALRSGATALITHNAALSLGALAWFRQQGVAVPRDMSVISIGDSPYAPFSEPPLTVMSVPEGELGIEAWHRLRLSMTKGGGGRWLWLQGSLIQRASTAQVD